MKSILASIAAAQFAGCAAAPPTPTHQPDVIVYVGPPDDPRYRIPEEVKAKLLQEREQWARFQQEAEKVLALARNDPAFGGLILRGSPEPRAVVMFTGNAEARLRRYTTDPRFRPRNVDLTLTELERIKEETADMLSRLGLACFTVDGDEQHNSVTVGAPPEELVKVRSAIASGTVRPPPKLRLVAQGCPQFR